MPTLTIDGRPVEARDGDTILDAARGARITIPTLCHHRDLSPDGSCRLCVVEVEGVRGHPAACTTPARDGMVVSTETPELAESRRFVLDMLLANYHDAEYGTGDRAETEFEHWVRHYGARPPADTPPPRYPIDADPNPFLRVDLNKCVRCTRCVRACAEVQGRFVWGMGYRGDAARPVAGLDTTLLDARCESCGACAAYCPTGALDDRTSVGRGVPDRVVTTTCPFCGVGCNFDLHVKDDRVVRVASNPAAPVNGMSLCVKGRYGFDFVHHPDRLTRPRVRRYLLTGTAKQTASPEERDWVETDWDTALNLVAAKLEAVRRESGPDAAGFVGSALCTNEENYLVQKLARQVIGTHNVENCARLCHAPTVAGLSMAFGSGAMSNSMDDVAEEARAVFVIGENVTECHPVFGTRLRQAVLRRGVPLVVADPRKTDVTEFAAVHLRLRPGTDVALLNGLMHVVLKNGWHDRRFIEERCEGFEELRAGVERYTPEAAEAITGVPAADLRWAAELLAQSRPTAAVWGVGVTQHTTGVLNVLALANLQMLLGNMGVPGGGANALRGQNSVQGACDMGALFNLFPGYQPVTSPAALAKFDAAWALDPPAPRAGGTPALGLTGRPGQTLTEMVDAFGAGALRALFVMGENLALTNPDLTHTRGCLAAGEFLVLQELFPTETAEFADVLLPGAAFAEKAGTFTNTERRVQLIRPAVPPPGEARPDWAVLADLARRTLAAAGRAPVGPHAGWTYRDPAHVMDEVAAVAPLFAGVSHARLERGDRLQWPVPSPDHPGTPILHVGGFARGKGKFHAVEHAPAAELPDAEFPFVLTTGRVLQHYGSVMTRRAEALTAACPEPVVEVSPDDAARLGLTDGAAVRLRSRRGAVVSRAVVTDRVAAGCVFGNFHFPGAGNVNNVTTGALDPTSKTPEFKVCAVAVDLVSPAGDE
ncbi:MAG: formate dehydrogenase subunit alpha [Gemmataceae bacterium]